MPSASARNTNKMQSCNHPNNANNQTSRVLVQPYYDGSLLSRFSIRRQHPQVEKIGKKQSRAILIESFANYLVQQQEQCQKSEFKEDCEVYATQLLQDTLKLLYVGSAHGMCQQQPALKRTDKHVEASMDPELLVNIIQ